MIRISGGRLKGRQIATLKGSDTRPTLAKTRDAIFNVLSSRYELADFEAYDIFASSGALGFEAYSRGIEHVVLIDRNPKVVSLLKKNIDKLSLSQCFKVICDDAIQWIKCAHWQKTPKLFLIDPPYQTDLVNRVVAAIDNHSHSPDGSVLVIETNKKQQYDIPDHFTRFKQKVYGQTRLDFIEIENG